MGLKNESIDDNVGSKNESNATMPSRRRNNIRVRASGVHVVIKHVQCIFFQTYPSAPAPSPFPCWCAPSNRETRLLGQLGSWWILLSFAILLRLTWITLSNMMQKIDVLLHAMFSRDFVIIQSCLHLMLFLSIVKRSFSFFRTESNC